VSAFVYVGPFNAVDIPSLGVEGLTPGVTFDVPADLVAAFTDQPDNFVPAAPIVTLPSDAQEG
jgi:hypothetical protein